MRHHALPLRAGLTCSTCLRAGNDLVGDCPGTPEEQALRREVESVKRELAMVRREFVIRLAQIDALERCVMTGTPLQDELRAQLDHVNELDAYAARLGTRLEIPSQLPGLDEDHAHFVLMPIGPAARRAAVAYLKSKNR